MCLDKAFTFLTLLLFEDSAWRGSRGSFSFPLFPFASRLALSFFRLFFLLFVPFACCVLSLRSKGLQLRLPLSLCSCLSLSVLCRAQYAVLLSHARRSTARTLRCPSVCRTEMLLSLFFACLGRLPCVVGQKVDINLHRCAITHRKMASQSA